MIVYSILSAKKVTKQVGITFTDFYLISLFNPINMHDSKIIFYLTPSLNLKYWQKLLVRMKLHFRFKKVKLNTQYLNGFTCIILMFVFSTNFNEILRRKFSWCNNIWEWGTFRYCWFLSENDSIAAHVIRQIVI